MPMSLTEILDALAGIDNHVESIALSHPAGSDLNVLAYAIHNLVTCVEALVNLNAERL